MLFNTTVYFLLFVPSVVAVTALWIYGGGYFLARRGKENIVIAGRNIILLLASFVFYGYWRLSFLPVLLGSILLNYIIGFLIVSPRWDARPRVRYGFFVAGIAFNVILIGVFKYIDFAVQNVAQLFVWMHCIKQLPQAYHWTLPLGISFFTFQQIAYLADCYKEKSNCRSILEYSLFVAFWPQLIAGPIVRHHEMIPQFKDVGKLYFNNTKVIVGGCIFLIGLSKKMLVADPLGAIADFGYLNFKTLMPSDLWSMTYAYTLQLYFDFSGYCDMAIGIALLFNFALPVNFNSPYLSTSIQEFWRRWHITLSAWLRDYVYIPLGGNRCAVWKHFRNLFLTFLVAGIWHGAGWTFVVWGCMHGLAIVIHNIWKKQKRVLPTALAWLVTMVFVHFAWIFFRAPDLSSATKIIGRMFTSIKTSSIPVRYHVEGLLLLGTFLLLLHNSMQIKDFLLKHLESSKIVQFFTLVLISILTILCIVAFCATRTKPSPFLYFQF